MCTLVPSLPSHHLAITSLYSHPHCHSACYATLCMLPLMMPYNSQPPLSENARKNVFNYVLWSMALPMSEESEVIKYYNQFLDFAEPLLDACILEDKECEELFWYGFHLDDRQLLLQQLFLKFPDQPLATYFHLQRVFPMAHDIFSQVPNKLLQEC
jgi:hypothetical protein